MSQRNSGFRFPWIVISLGACVALGLAQAGTAQTHPQGTPTPASTTVEQAAPSPATAGPAGSASATARRSRYPVVNDPRLTASPAQRFVGPAGSTDPFGGTAMTENQCRDMERCQVVQGQGPSYATWCRCGKGKLTTFTYIHD